ncbi:MAG: Xaa-Pro peptidase family protein [Thermodesulfovibrionales bacterium]|nr:Xaa-Pro peptidase family protein [Thermodesulfovibrionales bacterium]
MQTSKSTILSRTTRIQKIIKKNKIDAILISNIRNIRYLTGFTGSSGFVLITANRRLFFTDSRYTEQAEQEIEGFEIGMGKGMRPHSKPMDTIRSLIRKMGIRNLGFETSVSYEFFENLKKLKISPVPQKYIVENLRKIKDDEEIDNIKEAINRAERAFLKVKPRIRRGIRERSIALRLEEELKKGGCRSIPFDIIVASGKNSAMPHAKPSDKKIEKGDFVIIDWGGEANGYYSDMTRTFLVDGGALSEKVKIYNIVNEARKSAIRNIKEGIKTMTVDNAARNTIKKAGYGEYFGHGTGHGIGLDVHEYPHVSWAKSEKILNRMVFTIEPGIYIPDICGVRIEDMVEVKNGKAELLTTLDRELEIIN